MAEHKSGRICKIGEKQRMINKLIDELVVYGMQTGLVDEIDAAYTKNKLLELFDEQFYAPSDFSGEPRPVNEILDDMMVIAHEKGIMEDDTITTKDLFDTKIMGLLTPPPSVVQRVFAEKYAVSPKEATDYYYALSQATNYIRKIVLQKMKNG
jgi:UDPglucose--hexose-1-phosphate uridylyltransferase